MRKLWPIERAVLEAAAHDYQSSADALRKQIATACVTQFENTGVGFFSTVKVSPDTPRVTNKSPLDAATGRGASLPHGMGFLVFLEEGQISLIEAYTHDGSAADLDFQTIGSM